MPLQIFAYQFVHIKRGRLVGGIEYHGMGLINHDQVKKLPQVCADVSRFIPILQILLDKGVGADDAALENNMGSPFGLQQEVLPGVLDVCKLRIVKPLIIVPTAQASIGGQIIFGEQLIDLGAPGGDKQYGTGRHMDDGTVMAFVIVPLH